MNKRNPTGSVSELFSLFFNLALDAEIIVFWWWAFIAVLDVGVYLGVYIRFANVSYFAGTHHALHDQLSDTWLEIDLAFIRGIFLFKFRLYVLLFILR